MTARIADIFKSIQGEGPYQGVTQAFVRFYGCNLACAFCDTPQNTYQERSVEAVLSDVLSLGQVHSVSLTGGEPLLQVDFVAALAKALRDAGYKIYLETNGVLPEALTRLIDLVDIVSMDFKLPTSCGGKALWAEHGEFLKVACRKELFVKAVVGPATQIGDILETIRLIKTGPRGLLLVLQPQHPHEEALRAKLMFYKMLCHVHGLNVKILGQLHKKLGIK